MASMAYIDTIKRFRLSNRALHGFTLAELLIALVILGIIATFTIPKVISSQQDSKRKAVIKEIVATLSDITYQGVVNQDGLSDTNLFPYFQGKLNYTKSCSGDANAQGCWTQPFNVTGFFNYQGFTLANGATLSSFNNCCDYGGGQAGNAIAVDWNGSAPPNVYGDDQFSLMLSWGNKPITIFSPYTYKVGTVSPDRTSPESVAVFNSVFQ